MHWKVEYKPLLLILAVFLACFWLPVGGARFDSALLEGLHLVKWYAREHVILCLVPAFFIAGAIATFVSQGSVMRYLGARANKLLAYSVAATSGTILAVCSCTRASTLRRNLSAGSRAWTRDGVSLLGSRHQRARHHPHGAGPRPRTRRGTGHRCHRLQYPHWSPHAHRLSERS